MKNLKVGVKLIVSFAIVIVLFIVSVCVAATSLTQIGNEVTRFHSNAYMAKDYASQIQIEFGNVQKSLYRAASTSDAAVTKESVTSANNSVSTIKETIPKLSAIFASKDNTMDGTLGTKLTNARDDVNPLRDKAIEYASNNQNDQAIALLEGELGEKLTVMDSVLEQIATAADTESTNMLGTLNGLQVSSIVILLIVAAVSLVMTIILCIYITRSLTVPLDEVKRAAFELSEGNLSARITYTSKDEVGQLSDALRGTISALAAYIGDLERGLADLASGDLRTRPAVEYKGDFVKLEQSMMETIESFNEVLTNINQSADQVASGSDQVSSGAQALSQGATEQASSVEELSATITEISAKVKTNAVDAADASQKVGMVADEIMMSNQQMQELIAAMSEISSSSSQIGQIINTIENIAFQTNILALNAAVEAARAGAAGKGFAVVADEVRSLASKSSEAAKDTTALIQSSIESVERGTKLADAAAQSLITVVDSAKTVTETVDRIAGASNEQASSISQVSQGIEQISSVVQTNSATAEESAAASEELSGQAQVLKSLVSRFKLMENRSYTPPATGTVEFSGVPEFQDSYSSKY